MRTTKIIAALFISLLLSACVSSLLIGNQVQSKLMWTFLKPLVGFDPNEVKFFEAPIIKDRMTAMLGDKYEPTMKLLRTAQEIQQEGALFYVASRYAPAQVQAVTDKAGMVWNSQTNQMAVMLIKDGKPEIFSEQIEGAKEAITPLFPQELQNAYGKAKAVQDALIEKQSALKEAQETLTNPAAALGETLNKKVDDAINKTNADVDALQEQQKSTLQNAATDTLPLTDEEELERALQKEAMQ